MEHNKKNKSIFFTSKVLSHESILLITWNHLAPSVMPYVTLLKEYNKC